MFVNRLTSDGMLMNTGTSSSPVYNRQYFLKDHLGNVRVVFDQNGVVKQVSNYYPFGMEYGESAEDQTEMTFQDYQFGGKEFERDFELNMYDFGARNYDATMGRWTTPDPHAENYYSISPYAYCNNNSILFVDLDGKDYSLLFDDFKNIMSKLVYKANTLIKHEVKQAIKKVNSVAKNVTGSSTPLISVTSTKTGSNDTPLLKTVLGDKITNNHSVSETIGKKNGLINLDIETSTNGEAKATLSNQSGNSISVNTSGMVGAGVKIQNSEVYFSYGFGVGLGEWSWGSSKTSNGVTTNQGYNIRPGGGAAIGAVLVVGTIASDGALAPLSAATLKLITQ